VHSQVLVAFAVAIGLAAAGPASAAGGRSSEACPGDQISTVNGCVSAGQARDDIEAIVDDAVESHGLRAALVRVELGDRTLSKLSRGESMAGAPADMRMHFRIGSMAIPHLITLLLQLQDDGRLSLEDPLSNWLPQVANSDEVTLRMLGNSISGYPDWAQGNDSFSDTLSADPFRQWRQSELLKTAFDQPIVCDPGACFHYAHTNFMLLQKVIRKETGESVARLIRRRVFRPFGMRQTKISAEPGIPEPVLHAYYSGRGFYEDSTYWSPSWTIGHDTIMTGTIGDLVKAARGIGTGTTLSAESSRDRFAPTTVGLSPALTPSFYFGLGILVENDWQWQNPNLTGFTGIQGYFPPRDISVGLTVTNGKAAAATDINYSQRLFNSITDYLTPGNPVTFQG
jgi:D-alanyl-D-alanine carboxypeptidase